MATIQESDRVRPQERFGIRLLKFCAKIFGVLLLAGAFAFAAYLSSGVLQWVFGGLAILCLAALALFGSASSSEVQRSLGPLPLGRPGKDLTIPLSKEWRAERAAKGECR